MGIRRPVPQHPREGVVSPNWDKWFNLVSNNSIRILDFHVTLNPASVSASTSEEQDFTVPGLGANDYVLNLTKPSLTAGIGIGNVRVKAADTLSVTFINATAGAVDPPSEEYLLVVIRQ